MKTLGYRMAARVTRIRRSYPKGETGSRLRERGQVLAIFSIMSIVLLGSAAFVTDVAWWWTNEQRMQRAADAAALAGAVYLPRDEATAFQAARDEATKNGYTSGGQVSVTPKRDLNNPRTLIVDIDAPVETNFARVFCWDGGPCLKTVDVGVTGAAEFVLPVPMGSPENYYGVFGPTRGLTSTGQQLVLGPPSRGYSCGGSSSWPADSGCLANVPTAALAGTWTASNPPPPLAGVLQGNDNEYAQTGSNGAQQVWSDVGAQSGIPSPAAGETLAIAGLQVRLTDAFIDSSCSGGNARVDVQLSWDAGTSWSSVVQAPGSGSLGTSNSSDYVLGSGTGTGAWGGHTWVRSDFDDPNFRVRLTANETCTGGKTFSVDRVDVRVGWDYSQLVTQLVTTNLPDQDLQGPGSTCTTGKADCFEADGPALTPRGFWGTLNTQGAENVNGDAHQPGYDTRTSGLALTCPVDSMACYDGTTYYNYAVEMPPGATAGAVYIYDPQFCSVASDRGTGDRFFGGSGANAVSTFYTLYNTNNTLLDLTDDARLAPGNDGVFRGLDAQDSTMGGSNGSLECRYRSDIQYGDGRDFHNRWYRLYTGLTGGAAGTVYRLHISSTDPTDPTQQLTANGENSFAIYTSASVPGGGSPRVYGLGAMQAYTPLRASGSEVVSEFYLAQIEAAHADKTLEIQLWDPGDTRPLNARLQILMPTSGGWTPATFSYTAAQGTTNSNRASCNSLNNPGTDIVETNVGATNGTFNGCWLTLQSVIPSDYTAEQQGWWRIRYRMNGNGYSNDVTTWKVNLIGNPVHLVPR